MKLLKNPPNHVVCGRQIAFAAAFLLPMGKLLEAPSLLAKYAKGDLLAPAFLHFFLQAAALALLLFALRKSKYSLAERLQAAIGKWAAPIYLLFAAYYLFAAVLPLLDLEKFTYAAFSDTEPTLFVFASFFFLAAFICTKSLKSIARCADLCLFLFLIPFCALLAMGAFKADFSHLLPLFGTPLEGTMSAFTHTIPHFSDLTMLLPLLFFYQPRKGDEKKILLGYGVGALCTLAFLAVFFGLYASIAPREHYAFSKIAQYFPALSVIGRLDLFFVYLISIVLLFFTCLPLQYATELVCATFSLSSRHYVATAINIAAFFFTLFCNKYYDSIYALFCKQFPIIFVLFAYLPPIFACFLPKDAAKSSIIPRAKNTCRKEDNHA